MKKSPRSKAAAFAVLFFAAAALFAQDKLFKIPDRKAPYAEPRPEPLNRTELTVVFTGDDVELDFRKSYLASEAQVFSGIYEGLYSYNPVTLDPAPGVALSSKTSDDKKTWTFTLRRDAKFSNGDPVRARDFRDSWISLLDPAKNSPYSSLYDIIAGARDYRLGNITDPAKVGISAPDDQTLVVTLNSPAAFFRSMLCHHSFSPIHPSMLKARDWSKPVGNGAYYVEENDGTTVVLAKNNNYWDAKRVVLEKITLRFTDDDEDSTAMWNSGEARWIAGNVDIDALTDKSGIEVNAMFATHYYYIRSAGPWSDYRLRRALVLALPWEEIRNKQYLPAKSLIFPIPNYPQIKGFDTTDIDEAQKLLEQAGYPKGVGLPELVVRITPSEEADRIGKIMASAWMDKLGIPVKLDVVPYNRYFDSLKQKDYNVGSTTWIGDFADPYTFLQMWRADSNLNDADYNDPDYEALIDKSMGQDGTERYATLGEAEQMLLDRGTVLPVSYTPALNIVDTEELGGWYPNALDIHPFKYFNFKAYKPLPGVAKLP